MLGYEAYLATLFFAFAGVVIGAIFWHTFLEPAILYVRHNISDWIHGRRECTPEELEKISMMAENALDEKIKSIDDQKFFEMIRLQNEGKLAPEMTESSSLLPVLVPCSFHNCSLHASRADCCRSEVIVNGEAFCTALIDINSMEEVGLKRYTDEEQELIAHSPEPLTLEECKQFQDAYLKFMKTLEAKGIFFSNS